MHESLSLLRTFRGKRGGHRLIKFLCNLPIKSLYRSRCLGELSNASSLRMQGYSRFGRTKKVSRKENLVNVERQHIPNTFKPISFTLLNARSVRNKSLTIKDFVVDNDIDILALTETWLRSDESDEFIIRDLRPEGYECFSVPRRRCCVVV